MTKPLNGKGFTIVELMIATSVFSIVLLGVSAAIIQISRSYTKSNTTIRTQETSRNVIADISQGIQFSAGQVESGPGWLCVDGREYHYVKGQQVVNGNYGLIVNYSAGCTVGPTSSLAGKPTGYTELLGAGMRIANLSVVQNGDFYNVKARVVNGDDDLLCTGGAQCEQSATISASDLTSSSLRCKNIKAGNEFCAMSELTTTVQKRL